MATLFVSDLHLDESRPAITQLFLDLLAGEAACADALYILGDLFESWIGDDDDSPLAATVVEALRTLTRSGVYCAFLHGNRDFLVGERFAADTGVALLPETSVVDLHGVPTLLLHGDTLCTDDKPYLAFRAQVRNAAWQQAFLAQPLAARRAFAERARAESAKHTASAQSEIMDANATAVSAMLRQHGVRRMIHGHTHRPAIHSQACEGDTTERIVLGDWYACGSLLRVSPTEVSLHTLR